MEEKDFLVAKMYDDVIMPSKRLEDGGFDIYAYLTTDELLIRPHETVMLNTGIKTAFSSKYVAILKERGSTGKLGIGQRAGVVDSGYRGEWMVPVTNHGDIPIIVSKLHDQVEEVCSQIKVGDEYFARAIYYPASKAITQCIVVPLAEVEIVEASEDDVLAVSSERGDGAFGSSEK